MTSAKKVLIAEDEASILNGISDKFTHEGFSVIGVKDGREALNSALKEHPDIILLDLLMPDYDGFYFLENLRKDDWGKNARVIMWSNSHDSKSLDRVKELGILYFMIKSDWEYKDVVNKAREILGTGTDK